MEFIEFNKEQRRIIKALEHKQEVATTAFLEASEILNRTRNLFWNRIHELFPQSKKYADMQILQEDGAMGLLMMDKKKTEQAGAADLSDKTPTSP